MYNSTKEIRAEYDEKVRVYLKNHIPTVILYPHELGFLDYAFHKKILKVLKLPKFKDNFKMFRYKLSRYFSIGKGYFFFMSLFSLMLSMGFLVKSESKFGVNNILYLFFFATAFGLLYQFIYKFARIFFYDD